MGLVTLFENISFHAVHENLLFRYFLNRGVYSILFVSLIHSFEIRVGYALMQASGQDRVVFTVIAYTGLMVSRSRSRESI